MMTTRHPPDITRRIPLRDTSGKSAPAPQQSMPEICSHNTLPIGRRNPKILSGCRYDGLTPSTVKLSGGIKIVAMAAEVGFTRSCNHYLGSDRFGRFVVCTAA